MLCGDLVIRLFSVEFGLVVIDWVLFGVIVCGFIIFCCE